MSNSDHDRLRDAIAEARGNMGRSCMVSNAAIEILVAAAESTLPKTKMVEVWHCSWAVKSPGGVHFLATAYDSRQGADGHAAYLALGGFADAPAFGVKVTGPYMQEVPA